MVILERSSGCGFENSLEEGEAGIEVTTWAVRIIRGGDGDSSGWRDRAMLNP